MRYVLYAGVAYLGYLLLMKEKRQTAPFGTNPYYTGQAGYGATPIPGNAAYAAQQQQAMQMQGFGYLAGALAQFGKSLGSALSDSSAPTGQATYTYPTASYSSGDIIRTNPYEGASLTSGSNPSGNNAIFV